MGKYAPTPNKAQTSQAASEKAAPEIKLPETTSVAPPLEDKVEVSSQLLEKSVQSAKTKEGPTLDERLAKRISEAIADAESRTNSVAFRVDNENGEVIVKIVNKESGDVIREIPSDEVRNIKDRIQELKGMFISDVS